MNMILTSCPVVGDGSSLTLKSVVSEWLQLLSSLSWPVSLKL